MIISIGGKIQAGSWGGGNQFAKALSQYFDAQGHRVIFDLNDQRIDCVLLLSPNPKLSITAYTDREIFAYLRKVNPQALVVQRVNECDERKGTNGVNRMFRRANRCADRTVFVSEWLKNLHWAQGWPRTGNRVILNGSDTGVFHAEGYRPWNRAEPLRLVTHHWGSSWNKGFEIYQQLDRMIGDAAWRDRIQFSYIGNLPENFRFHNSRYYEPHSGRELAALIKQHHVYLTASKFEPGSNHQNEGALCGLPVLYLNHGSMPEYCAGYGVEFTENNFAEQLETMLAHYAEYMSKMKTYPWTAERMCREYATLFENMLERRDEIVAARDPWRYWKWLLG